MGEDERVTGKQCGEINNETRERSRKEELKGLEKMNKKPRGNKRSVLELLHEKEKRRKHDRRFHFYNGGETTLRREGSGDEFHHALPTLQP